MRPATDTARAVLAPPAAVTDNVPVSGSLPARGTATPAQVAALAFDIFSRRLGLREKPNGSNRDGDVISRGNLRTIGVEAAYWCMTSVWLAFQEAAEILGVENPLPRVGYVSELFRWAKRATTPALIVAPSAVESGFVLPKGSLFGHGRAGSRLVPGELGPAHVGFVSEVGPRGVRVQVRQGNHSNKFSEDWIPLSQIDAFIIFPE